MKKKIHMVAGLLMVAPVAANAEIPSELAGENGIFTSRPSTTFSDEFNKVHDNSSPFNKKKWHVRKSIRTGNGTDPKYFEQKDGHLYLKGLKGKKKGGGIVSSRSMAYGFYSVKFRAEGIKADARSAWHPAIWAGSGDSRGNYVEAVKKNGWLEVDMIEFATWSAKKAFFTSGTPARYYSKKHKDLIAAHSDEGKSLGWSKPFMFDGRYDTYTVNGEEKVIGATDLDEWKIFGLEYTKEYLQMWKKVGEDWMEVGHRINFVKEAVPSDPKKELPTASRSRLFWNIGNMYLPQANNAETLEDKHITNSALVIDWFRYYPVQRKKR